MKYDGKKILLVDDEEHIVSYLQLSFEDDVEHIFTAYNGLEALEIFKKHPDIDVILSDIRMPKMDGLRLIEEIRKTNKTVPVIFFTGFGSEKYMVDALKFGAYDFINKPELENVEEVVFKLLDNLDNKDSSRIEAKLKDDIKKIL